MNYTIVKIDSEMLAQSNMKYLKIMGDENRAVRDPVITPFGMAMELAGYVNCPEGGVRNDTFLSRMSSW